MNLFQNIPYKPFTDDVVLVVYKTNQFDILNNFHQEVLTFLENNLTHKKEVEKLQYSIFRN